MAQHGTAGRHPGICRSAIGAHNNLSRRKPSLVQLHRGIPQGCAVRTRLCGSHTGPVALWANVIMFRVQTHHRSTAKRQKCGAPETCGSPTRPHMEQNRPGCCSAIGTDTHANRRTGGKVSCWHRFPPRPNPLTAFQQVGLCHPEALRGAVVLTAGHPRIGTSLTSQGLLSGSASSLHAAAGTHD